MLKRVVIIGGGIAGLALAIRLQSDGYEVQVFEANEGPGGKLGELKLGPYRFDTGPSLFTMPQFVEELFTLAGEKMSDHFTYKKKDIVCEYFFEDSTRFTAYADMEKYLQEAERVFNVEPKVLKKYFANSKLKYNRTKSIFLEHSLHKVGTYFSLETIKSLANLRSLTLFSTLNEWNEKKLGNEKLVQLFNRYATYNGSSPYQTPAIMSMIPHLEQHFGTFFPDKGMFSIVESLYNLARAKGVKFHFDTMVERIIISYGRAVGILAGRRFFGAESIISTMDIVPTYKYLMPHEKAPAKILNQERSSSAIVFYWGMKRKFPELNLHNIFFAEDYKAEFDSIFKTKTVGDDITVYVNISSKEIPSDAPEDGENWFVMVNVPANNGQDWNEILFRTRQNVYAKLSRILKVNIEEFVACESSLDPRKIERNTFSFQGALYGASSNDPFAAFLRHKNFAFFTEQLYFCGGTVHPGGGIPLCLMSAKITAEIVKNTPL